MSTQFGRTMRSVGDAMHLGSGRHREGAVARAIEERTADIPSDVFLWAACGSVAASLSLKLLGRDHTALFVGQWAAPFLLLGLYNKLVKLEGSDRYSR